MDTETAEVDSPQTTETADENVSLDDLRAALGHNEPEPQGEEQQPVAEATEDQVPPEPEQPPPAEGQQPEAESERLAKRRIRPKNELDQQVIDLYRSDAFDGSFADATRVIYSQTDDGTNRNPQPQPEATQPESDGYREYVAGIQGQIQELEQKVATAADELETIDALKFQREIMKKELELQTAQSRKERYEEAQEQNAYNTHRGKSMESRNKVFEKYPVLQDKNSVHRKQFDDFVQRSSNDPDYAAVFESPKWPELMANEFASAYNARRQQAAPVQQQQPAPVVPPQAPPQMGTQAKVLTTGTAAQPVHAQPTAQSMLSDMPNISKDDLYSLLGNPGGPQPRV